MAATNTEKPTSKAEKKKTIPAVKENKPKKVITSKEKTQKNGIESEEKIKKKEVKKEVKIPKKEKVEVNARGLRISTKVSVAISKFIKGKSIDNAIKDLEEVAKLKKAVPMKGEIAHRKGRIMSGKFPQKAAKETIQLLKSLKSNAIQHDLENPIITESISNVAQRPYAKGGRARKKATNLKIIAKEKKTIKRVKKKE